jgi:hypothetical protein
MAARVDMPAHRWRAAVADIYDRAAVAGQDVVVVALQIAPAMPPEYVDNAVHGR